MSLNTHFHEFYTSLQDIAVVNQNLDSKRDELKAIMDDFNQYIQGKTIAPSLLKKNDQLGQLLQNTVARLQGKSEDWVNYFNALLHQEKFRSDLENYFIVIIFGKVKAGKSSLGNFIANNNTTAEKASFFKYDEAENEQAIQEFEEIDDDDSNEFAVDNCECTVEIQGFRLGGLAWVDTPGLGSMVKENGELAKKYIQAADYIIYPTSSSSPLQQDEITQLKELFSQKKPVSICITMSDITERRKDEYEKYIKDKYGKIIKFPINKPEKQRLEQEAYVKDEIKKILIDQSTQVGDVLSISAHIATEALKTHDKSLLQGSNILKFYDLITDIIQQKASVLKAAVPYNGFLSFIDNHLLSPSDEVSGSIQSLDMLLKSFDQQIQEVYEKFEMIKENTNSDIKAEIDYIISSQATSIDKENAKDVFTLIDEKLNQNIANIINNNIKKTLKGFQASLRSLDSMLNAPDTFNICDEYREIEVGYEDRSWVNIITFGTFGRSYSSVEETVHVGDNKERVIIEYKENRMQAHVQNALANYDQVIQILFDPLSEVSKNIQQYMKQLKQDVESFKLKLEGEK